MITTRFLLCNAEESFVERTSVCSSTLTLNYVLKSYLPGGNRDPEATIIVVTSMFAWKLLFWTTLVVNNWQSLFDCRNIAALHCICRRQLNWHSRMVGTVTLVDGKQVVLLHWSCHPFMIIIFIDVVSCANDRTKTSTNTIEIFIQAIAMVFRIVSKASSTDWRSFISIIFLSLSVSSAMHQTLFLIRY